jgi:hypothetical protein
MIKRFFISLLAYAGIYTRSSGFREHLGCQMVTFNAGFNTITIAAGTGRNNVFVRS